MALFEDLRKSFLNKHCCAGSETRSDAHAENALCDVLLPRPLFVLSDLGQLIEQCRAGCTRKQPRSRVAGSHRPRGLGW